MAQTGKLGTADSQLANLQLAFTTADPALPSVTTESGRLGGQLGDTVLALGGVIGASVIHLAAESVLAAAQTADPAPTFAPHASPLWALGGQDSQLGDTELAFAGADAVAAGDYHPERPARRATGRSGPRPRRAGRRGRHPPVGRERAGDRRDGGPCADVRAPPVSGLGLGRPGRPAWRDANRRSPVPRKRSRRPATRRDNWARSIRSWATCGPPWAKKRGVAGPTSSTPTPRATCCCRARRPRALCSGARRPADLLSRTPPRRHGYRRAVPRARWP